jgi:hypothetical protein
MMRPAWRTEFLSRRLKLQATTYQKMRRKDPAIQTTTMMKLALAMIYRSVFPRMKKELKKNTDGKMSMRMLTMKMRPTTET